MAHLPSVAGVKVWKVRTGFRLVKCFLALTAMIFFGSVSHMCAIRHNMQLQKISIGRLLEVLKELRSKKPKN